MKNTSGAYTFLKSAYVAVFKSAYAKGVASAVIMTAGLTAGASQATEIAITGNAGSPTSAVTATTSEDFTNVTSGSTVYVQGITVSEGAKYTVTGALTDGGAISTVLNSTGPMVVNGQMVLDKIRMDNATDFDVTVSSTGNLDLKQSQVNATDLTIAGKVTIDGILTNTQAGGTVNYRTVSSLLGGYNSGDVTVSDGAEITLGDYASFVVNQTGTLNFNGGKLIFDGSVIEDTFHVNGNLSILRGCDDPTPANNAQINLNGGEIVVNASKIGSIFAPSVNLAGTDISVGSSAILNLDGDFTDGGEASQGDGTRTSGAFVMSEGTINNAGTLNIGSTAKAGSDNNGTTFNATGGEIVNNAGAIINVLGEVKFAGAALNNQGTIAVKDYGSLELDSDYTVGGTVTVADNGKMYVDGAVTFAGGANLTNQGVIDVTDTLTVDSSLFSTSSLFNNGGLVNLGTNGTLNVTGANVDLTADAYNSIFDETSGAFESTAVSGGTVTRTVPQRTVHFDSVTIGATYGDQNLGLSADALTVETNATDNKFTVGANSQVTIGDSLTFAPNGTTTADPNITVAGTLSLDSDDEGSLGGANINVTATGTDGLKVENGSWGIGSLTLGTSAVADVANGASLSITTLDAGSSSALTVDGDLTVLGDNNASTATDVKTNAAANVTVKQGGTITFAEGVLSLNNDKDGLANTGFAGVTLSTGATANLNLGATTIEAADLAGILQDVVGNTSTTGLINLGQQVDVDGLPEVSGDGTIKWSQVKSYASFDLDNYNNAELVVDEASNIRGSYGIVRDDFNEDGVIDVEGTLKLNGSSNMKDGLLAYWVDETNNNAVKVANISLSGDSSLIFAASGKVGAVTTQNNATNSVIVERGHEVKVDSIGTSSVALELVQVDAGATLVVDDADDSSVNGVNAGSIEVSGTLQSIDGDVSGGVNVTGLLVAGDWDNRGNFTGTDITLTADSEVMGGTVIGAALTANNSLDIGSAFSEESAGFSVVKAESLAIAATKAVNVQQDGALVISDEDLTPSDLTSVPNYGASSVLYLGKTSAVNNISGILAVGNYEGTTTDGNVYVGSNSVTIVDGNTNTNETFITDDVYLEGNAKLVLKNVNSGDTIVSGSINTDAEGGYDPTGTGAWAGANVLMTNGFLDLSSGGSSLSVVEADEDVARARYSKLTNDEYAAFKDVALNNGQSDLISDLINDSGLGYDDQARSIDSVGRMIIAGGVVQSSLLASRTTTDAIAQRTGVGSVGNIATVAAATPTGASIWLNPIYANSDSDSYDAGAFEYGADVDLYGVALGVDYTNEAGFTAGVAMNIGSGESDSQGDLVDTSSDFDYFGFALYGAYEYEALKVAADVGYTFLSSDIDQNNYTDKFTTDVDSTIATFGIQAKYTFNVADVLDIAPHIGMRYLHLNVDDYDIVGDNYGYLAHGSSVDADIVQFPIGVSFSADLAAGNWTVKPALDISVIPATGDTDVDSDVNLDGYRLGYNTDVIDSCSYGATVGIEAAYGDSAAFGFSYSYFGSSDEDSQGLMVSARYTF